MDSTMPKQLGELLQEQQEPFTLEAYLLERGYLSSSNSTKFLKRPVISGITKRKKVVQNCSKIVKVVFNKLLSIDSKLKRKNCGSDHVSVTEKSMNSKEIAEEDKFSSASSTTVFNSCSQSEVEDAYDLSEEEHISATPKTCHALKPGKREEEVATEREFQWYRVEDSKQPSPVSVLDDIQFDEVRQNATKIEEESLKTCKKEVDESIFSVSVSNLSFHSSSKRPNPSCVGELQELVVSNHSSQYTKNKRFLQQSKQLLFDCMREVVESHRGKDNRSLQFQQFLGPEELWNLLYENIWTWSRLSIDETNIAHLLNLDFLDSSEKWSDLEQQRREIGEQIGDTILEDITNEIVMDLIKFT
ncbi:unnamed protein product [Ilex paraguariensis]|uniref:DUF4378 domain-containing protein n=1 Tax=Ilex paraguariensis TaxID=185542 RepID=A0ABC8RG29_9AQUA